MCRKRATGLHSQVSQQAACFAEQGCTAWEISNLGRVKYSNEATGTLWAFRPPAGYSNVRVLSKTGPWPIVRWQTPITLLKDWGNICLPSICENKTLVQGLFKDIDKTRQDNKLQLHVLYLEIALGTTYVLYIFSGLCPRLS